MVCCLHVLECIEAAVILLARASVHTGAAIVLLVRAFIPLQFFRCDGH